MYLLNHHDFNLVIATVISHLLGRRSRILLIFFQYRDASFGACSFNLSILDCLNGIYKVKTSDLKFTYYFKEH